MGRPFDARTILDLQQAVGNQCVNRLLRAPTSNEEPSVEPGAPPEREFFTRIGDGVRRFWRRLTGEDA
jgi:hypothetical protein